LYQFKLFQKVAASIFLFFVGVMVFVGFKAYSRQSGSTGLDMGKVQMMRAEARQISKNKR
jgi:hypothetical protein